jgi:hypothetical protein
MGGSLTPSVDGARKWLVWMSTPSLGAKLRARRGAVEHAVGRLREHEVRRARPLARRQLGRGCLDVGGAQRLVASDVERPPQPPPVVVGAEQAIDTQAQSPRRQADLAADDAGFGDAGRTQPRLLLGKLHGALRTHQPVPGLGQPQMAVG